MYRNLFGGSRILWMSDFTEKIVADSDKPFVSDGHLYVKNRNGDRVEIVPKKEDIEEYIINGDVGLKLRYEIDGNTKTHTVLKERGEDMYARLLELQKLSEQDRQREIEAAKARAEAQKLAEQERAKEAQEDLIRKQETEKQQAAELKQTQDKTITDLTIRVDTLEANVKKGGTELDTLNQGINLAVDKNDPKVDDKANQIKIELQKHKDRIKTQTDEAKAITAEIETLKKGDLNSRINDLKPLEDKLAKINSDLQKQNGIVNQIEGKLQNYERDVTQARTDLEQKQAIEKQKAEEAKQNIDTLNKKVDSLGGTVNVFDGEIENLKTRVKNFTDSSNNDAIDPADMLANLKNRLEVNKNRQQELQKEIRTLNESVVAGLEKKLVDIEKKIYGQEKSLGDLETQVNNYKTAEAAKSATPVKSEIQEDSVGEDSVGRSLKRKLIEKKAIEIQGSDGRHKTHLGKTPLAELTRSTKPLTKKDDDRGEFQILNLVHNGEKHYHSIEIHAGVGTDPKNLVIKFDEIARVAGKKGEPFTTKATFEQYPNQFVEHTKDKDGKMDVKIQGKNMVFNIEEDFTSTKFGAAKKLLHVGERHERPRVTLEYPPSEGKPVLEAKNQAEADVIQKRMKGTKINGVDFDKLEWRPIDKSQSVENIKTSASSMTANDLLLVSSSNLLQGVEILDPRNSLQSTGSAPDTRPRSNSRS